MRYIFLVTYIILSIASGAQKSDKKGFTVLGNITGIADSTSVKIEDANTNNLLASGIFRNEKFTLKGSVPEPTLCWLKIDNEPQQYVYIENNNITITGHKPINYDLIVTGSPSHIEFLDFQKMFNPPAVKLQTLVPTINSTPVGKVRDSLLEDYRVTMDVIQKGIDQFMASHKSSYVAPFMLLVTAQYYEDPILLEERYNRLDQSLLSTQIGKSLKSYIDYNKIGAIGTQAVDFTQPDTSGVPVKLSSFKGRYVLVDFWASWCGPCRMENPNVVANYNKFKEKNFTILGVSLDRVDQKQKWIDAIHKDNLTWTHVSDLQQWNNAAAQLYKVSGIPFNILVDPDGKIIGRNLRGPELNSKLCEVLGCN